MEQREVISNCEFRIANFERHRSSSKARRDQMSEIRGQTTRLKLTSDIRLLTSGIDDLSGLNDRRHFRHFGHFSSL